MHSSDEHRHLDRVRADLLREFAEQLPAEEVQRRFDDVVHRFDAAPIRDFVPVLAGRSARDELRRTAT